MKVLLFDHNLSPKLLHKLADIYPNSAHVSVLGLDFNIESKRIRVKGIDIGR